MTNDDLDALDRTTLQLWRSGNLVGWGAVGAVAGSVTYMVMGRIAVGALVGLGTGSTVLFAVAMALSVVAGGAVAGWLVGSHVYRSPRIVAALAVILPSSLVLLAWANAGPMEFVYLVLVPIIGSVAAALVAGRAYGRRPRALRATA